jgi:protein ImuA
LFYTQESLCKPVESIMQPVTIAFRRNRSRVEIVEDLRRLLPRMEGIPVDARVFPFGIAALDGHLPQGGLLSGALHEVVPEDNDDMPAAFGFMAALLARMPLKGPILLVISPRGIADHGRPYGHGLNGFGIDPGRLILVETENEVQALWAIEEALRSAVPAVVAGAVDPGPALKTSRRLHLAAENSGLPLLLLRPAGTGGSSAAATRWRIGAADAAHDGFGLLARWRWQVRLERCRNGRPGEWLVEYDHVAYRFSLAAAMADPALSRSGDTPPFARAG